MAPHVLLVEDDASLAGITRSLLLEDGFVVSVAKDGLAALELLADPAPPPNIIVTDLRMPRIGGVELLEALARDPRLRSIPVLVWSGMPPDDRPGVSWIPKPVAADSFLEAVRSSLPESSSE